MSDKTTMSKAQTAAVIRLHNEIITPILAQLAAKIMAQIIGKSIDRLAELEPFKHQGSAEKCFVRQQENPKL